MQFVTSRFGAVDVADEAIYDFPEGLPGFPDARRFALLAAERFAPFQWLQSLERPELAFLVVDPLLFKPDYQAEVSPQEAARIGLEKAEEGFLVVLLTVPRDPQEMTANLKAPVVFNRHRRVAAQFILSGSDHPIRHRVFAPAPSTPVVPKHA